MIYKYQQVLVKPKKFSWGDDVVKAFEKKFLEDPKVKDIINKKDFPCKFYSVV